MRYRNADAEDDQKNSFGSKYRIQINTGKMSYVES